MKRNIQQAVATRTRGRKVVQTATVAVATIAAGSSAGLAWAASSTATGRAHHTQAKAPVSQPRAAHRPDDDGQPPGQVPRSLTNPRQATVPQQTVPQATVPQATVPQPDPYVPPVVSSGGS